MATNSINTHIVPPIKAIERCQELASCEKKTEKLPYRKQPITVIKIFNSHTDLRIYFRLCMRIF